MLLAQAGAADADVQPVYVRTGLAWEHDEQAIGARCVSALPGVGPLAVLTVDMTDVYSAAHWAVRGEAPGFDTPDSDVYLEGRNIVLLSKTAVHMARTGSTRVWIGILAGNPFPDSSRTFFEAMGRALSTGLDAEIRIEAPLADMSKAEVIRLGLALKVPFELTLSCMQPVGEQHCGRCSKCRERLEAFAEAGAADPAIYASKPAR